MTVSFSIRPDCASEPSRQLGGAIPEEIPKEFPSKIYELKVPVCGEAGRSCLTSARRAMKVVSVGKQKQAERRLDG